MSDNKDANWFFVAASGAVTDNMLNGFNKEYMPTLPYARPPCRPGGLLRGEDGMLLFPVGEFSLFLTARKDRIRENIVSDKKKIRFFLVDYFFIFG